MLSHFIFIVITINIQIYYNEKLAFVITNTLLCTESCNYYLILCNYFINMAFSLINYDIMDLNVIGFVYGVTDVFY